MAKELPLVKTEELLMPCGMFLISFPLKAVSFTTCMLSQLSWKWKKKIFVLLFKIRKLIKNARWIAANCFKRDEAIEDVQQ